MLDGTLFIVKCARYGNPDKNLYQDFFLLHLIPTRRMVFWRIPVRLFLTRKYLQYPKKIL